MKLVFTEKCWDIFVLFWTAGNCELSLR